MPWASSNAGPTIAFYSSIGLQPSDVGTITLTQINATSVEVFLDLADTTNPPPRYGILNTGGPHTPFAFQISGPETGVTATFLEPSGGAYTFGMFSLNLNGGGATPYGTYGIAIDSSAGNGSSKAYFGDLKFQLSRPTGLQTTDFIANVKGYYFAADLTDGGCVTGTQAWATPVAVPEPETYGAILAVSLAGLAYMRQRRRLRQDGSVL